MIIDLRKCKAGDKLRIRLEGEIGAEMKKKGITDIVTYVDRSIVNLIFPHTIRYSDGSEGTRTDEGYVYSKKRRPDDMDIIEIL